VPDVAKTDGVLRGLGTRGSAQALGEHATAGPAEYGQIVVRDGSVERFFLNSAAVLLLITAAAKLVSSFGDDGVLHTEAPLTGMSFRSVFRLVAMAETVVALVCLFSRRPPASGALLAWLATNFLGYRLGLRYGGYHGPCGCLGSLTSALHIPAHGADLAMILILLYMLAGSYALLVSRYFGARRAFSPAGPIR
jgi:hypothetical protein